jgi:hypothetical protein
MEMMKFPKYILLSVFILAQIAVFAQIDDEYLGVLLQEDEEELANSAFKPVIGIGKGVFTYIGDVKDNYNVNPFAGRYGTKVSISRNISQFMDFNLFVIFGTLTGNSRTYSDLNPYTTNYQNNLNFETDLFIGGVNLSYNFKHLLQRERPITPFVSLGVETFEFSSKGDLKDASGRDYYFWSNGEIRSVSEASNNISESNLLQRDYTYETDLRELSGEKYSQFAFSMPIDIGLEIIVSNRMKMRIGNTFHLTNTDYIDNQEKKSGMLRNDAFLFTYAAFEFDLFSPAEDIRVVEQFKNLKFIFTDKLDADNDGIDDFNDECQNTPEEAKVDFRGCPIDTDEDGIPDYIDKQPDTPAGTLAVNEKGIRIIDTHLIAMLYEPDAVRRNEVISYYESLKEGGSKSTSYSGIPDKFKHVDADLDGYISHEELQKAIDSLFDLDSKLNVDDIKELQDFFFSQQ